MEEYNKGANAYTESMGGQLTEEQATAYIRDNFDKKKGFELDAEMMAQMLDMERIISFHNMYGIYISNLLFYRVL